MISAADPASSTGLLCPYNHQMVCAKLKFHQGFVHGRACGLCDKRIDRRTPRFRCQECRLSICAVGKSRDTYSVCLACGVDAVNSKSLPPRTWDIRKIRSLATNVRRCSSGGARRIGKSSLSRSCSDDGTFCRTATASTVEPSSICASVVEEWTQQPAAPLLQTLLPPVGFPPLVPPLVIPTAAIITPRLTVESVREHDSNCKKTPRDTLITPRMTLESMQKHDSNCKKTPRERTLSDWYATNDVERGSDEKPSAAKATTFWWLDVGRKPCGAMNCPERFDLTTPQKTSEVMLTPREVFVTPREV